MGVFTKLNRINSTFFFLGFLFNKLQWLSLGYFSFISQLTSLSLYFSGYIVWIITCELYPNHPPLKENWYGFNQFRKQNQFAAILGAGAILFSFAAIVSSLFFIPALFLFAASNIFWCISEYHKLKNPLPFDETYSTSRQQSHFKYTCLMTSLSIFTALAMPFTILFPPFSLLIVSCIIVVGMAISLTAINCWLDCNLKDHPPDKLKTQSYTQISQQLGFTNANTPSLTQEKNPGITSFKPLFTVTKISSEENHPPHHNNNLPEP